MASLATSIKLLPWCISFTVPSHYMSGALVNTTQQGKNVPATTVAVKLGESPTLGSSSSPAYLTDTLPPPAPILPDLPFVGTPPVGHPFVEFIAISSQKKWGCSSSSSLNNHCNRRTHVNSQEVKARSDHSSAQDDEDMPKLILQTGTSFEQ